MVIQVAHEMDMLCQSEGSMKAFEENWEKYTKIILSYSKSIPFQTKELRKILEELDGDHNGNFNNNV